MDVIVEASGLVKQYGSGSGAVRALDGLDLVAPAGKVLALLGPNGAGKTTLVRAIATLTRPSSGTLTVAGHDVLRAPEQVRRVIGLAGQYAAVEPALTGLENLRMVARLFGHRRREATLASERVLEQMGLADAGKRLVKTYSGGMRRRLDLGASLVGSPQLLLLDEPTTGLDPRSRSELWVAIEELVATGTDVLLTTQYLEEADRLADLIAIIDHGRLVASGTPDELKTQAGRDVVDVQLADGGDLDRAAAMLGPETVVDRNTQRLTVPVAGGADEMLARAGALSTAGITMTDVALRRPTLDDVFLALTGHPAERDAPEESDSGTGTGSSSGTDQRREMAGDAA
ncbi:MAG: type transport system ATP-binding protein [Frankiaceae bacterium]|nr:type transport system ATP-binding protein [Frankiaceae bacterium]